MTKEELNEQISERLQDLNLNIYKDNPDRTLEEGRDIIDKTIRDVMQNDHYILDVKYINSAFSIMVVLIETHMLAYCLTPKTGESDGKD